jgi:hypothetical protein
MGSIGKKTGTVFLVLAIVAIPLTAGALTFDFDTLPVGIIDGTNLGGVTITSGDGSARVVSDFGIGYRSPLNAVTNNNTLRTIPLSIAFDSLVSSVMLTGGDKGGTVDQFTVTAFNESNELLRSFTTPVFGGTDPADPEIMADFFTVNLEFNENVVKRVEVGQAIGLGGIGIDDLIIGFFTPPGPGPGPGPGPAPIPEPATMILLGSSLFGLAMFGRRRSKKG